MNSREGKALTVGQTGYDGMYNLLYSRVNGSFGNGSEVTKRYLNLDQTKKAIHAGVYNNGRDSYEKLLEDIVKSVEPNFTALIDKYKVMLYVGNMDNIAGVVQINGMLENPGQIIEK